MHRHALRICLLTVCLATAGIPQTGQGAAYLKFDGIPGESRDPAHQGWSDLQSFEMAAAARPRMALRKPIDKASPHLLTAATQNQVLPRVEIEFIRPAPGNQRYYHYSLESVRVLDCRHEISALAGVPSKETLTVDFQGLAWTCVEVDTNQVPVLDHTLIWDIVRGTTGVTPETAGLKIRSFRRTTTGDFQLEWLADAGKTYAIRRADDVGGPYLPWQQITAGANGLQTLPVPRDQARRFFLIEEMPVVSN